MNTIALVGDSLARNLPDRPIIITLGNNDSDCGDYEITPGGKYLAGTAAMVRRLAGDDLVGTEFDQTYTAGGYYKVRHPTHPDTLILVVNDVLWSAKYRDACGPGGDTAAAAMFAWLRENLSGQKARGAKVWLIHHIPWGIDPFSTAHAKEATCAAKVVPLLAEPYAVKYVQLLQEFADVIEASLASHIHTDDFRVLFDKDSPPPRRSRPPSARSIGRIQATKSSDTIPRHTHRATTRPTVSPISTKRRLSTPATGGSRTSSVTPMMYRDIPYKA